MYYIVIYGDKYEIFTDLEEAKEFACKNKGTIYQSDFYYDHDEFDC